MEGGTVCGKLGQLEDRQEGGKNAGLETIIWVAYCAFFKVNEYMLQ